MIYKNQIKSIAIGSFDGIHLGHQKLIDQVDALVIIERNTGYLTPGYKRSHFTSKICCFYHFDVIKGWTPEDFVHKLTEDFPMLERIVVGYDFHFGKNKAGTAESLDTLYEKEVLIVGQVTIEGIPVHSRTIKQYLTDGNIHMANKLLGRRHIIDGEVIKGQGLGKKELFPTLNLEVTSYQLPLEGVYATRTKIGNLWLPSVSFLGHRVTTDDSFAVESHVLETDIGTVSGNITIEFVDFIRNNQKFHSLDALKKQIQEDISSTKKCLGISILKSADNP